MMKNRYIKNTLGIIFIAVLLLSSCSSYERNIGKIKSEIKLNQKMSIGNVAEIAFTEVFWTYELKPSNYSENWYSYYESEEGEVFCSIKGEVKNNSEEDLDLTLCATSEFIFGETEVYTGIFAVEDELAKNFFGYDLAPGESAEFYLYAIVPEESKEKEFDVKVGFDDLKEYVYKIEDCSNVFSIVTD